jgi:hypothetical protein
MKKKKLIVLTMSCFFIYNSYAQVIEEDSIPIVRDPLLIYTEQYDSSGIKNFNSFDLSIYTHQFDFDLIRQTPNQELNYDLFQNSENIFNIDPDTIIYEGKSHKLNGLSTIQMLETLNLILGSDTLTNVKKIKINEKYTLTYENTLIAAYDNTYFAFINQLDSVVYEVYHKERIIKDEVGLFVDGITNNNNIEAPSINLSLNPNPSSNQVNIEFELWQEGVVTIFISNLISNVNEMIFCDYLETGENVIETNINHLTAGTYQITVHFEGATYSQTLLKL